MSVHITEESGELWERLPGETEKAWIGFRIYRDLPPGQRTLPDAYMLYCEETRGEQPEERPSHAPGYFSTWSSENEWLARAAAYDRYMDARAREHSEIDHIEKLNSHRERLLKYAEISSENGIRAMKVVENTLQLLLSEELDGFIEPKYLARFIQATAKLFETAADQEAKALAVDRLLEVLEDEGSLH